MTDLHEISDECLEALHGISVLLEVPGVKDHVCTTQKDAIIAEYERRHPPGEDTAPNYCGKCDTDGTVEDTPTGGLRCTNCGAEAPAWTVIRNAAPASDIDSDIAFRAKAAYNRTL